MDASYDVVVIGAGVAGLWCSRCLSSSKLRVRPLKVLVVEASARPGGRLQTSRSGALWNNSPPLDVGAEFIHGSNNVLGALADRAGIQRRGLFTWSPGDGGPENTYKVGTAYYGSFERSQARCVQVSTIEDDPDESSHANILEGFEAGWSIESECRLSAEELAEEG